MAGKPNINYLRSFASGVVINEEIPCPDATVFNFKFGRTHIQIFEKVFDFGDRHARFGHPNMNTKDFLFRLDLFLFRLDLLLTRFDLFFLKRFYFLFLEVPRRFIRKANTCQSAEKINLFSSSAINYKVYWGLRNAQTWAKV